MRFSASTTTLLAVVASLTGSATGHAQPPAAASRASSTQPSDEPLPLEPIPVGSPAPRLEGGEWLKGSLPEGYPDKGLFLVYFYPAIIPAEFQADHRQLQFILVLADNRRESDRQRYPKDVREKWKSHAADTPPNIMFFDRDGLAPWFGPGLRHQPGASHSFLIRDGKVIWIGRAEAEGELGPGRFFGKLAIYDHILGPYPINQPAPPWPALTWHSGPKLDGPPNGKLSLVTIWPLLKRGGDAAKRNEQAVTELRATLKKYPDLVSIAVLPVPSKDKIGSGPGKDDTAADRIKYSVGTLKPLGSVYASEGDQDRDDGFWRGWLRRYSLAASPAALIIDPEGRVAWAGPLSFGDPKSRGQRISELEAALNAVAAGQTAPTPTQFDLPAIRAKNEEREAQLNKDKRGPKPGP